MFKKNKILSFLLVVIIFCFATQANAADVGFTFAKTIGSTGVDYGTNIATDSSGNIYTTGTFNGTVDFDPSAAVTELTAPLVNSVYMAKYDSSGNFVWAKVVGSRIVNLEDRVVPAVYLDSSDNIYSVGNFTGTVDFDPGAGTTNLTSAVGHYDFYITKYDSSGGFVWAKQIGGTNDVQPHDIFINGSNIYITGIFGGTMDFDPDAGTTNLTASGWVDMFVLKLDLSGALVWVKQYTDPGSHFEQANSITVDSSDNVYVTGEFTGTLDLDPGAGTVNVTASGATWEMNVFISKLDSSGAYVWGKAFIGGIGWDSGSSLKVDSSGNVYVAGAFAGGTVDFDPDGGTYNLTATAGSTQYIADIYISKLNSSGALVWVKQIGNSGNDGAGSLQLDNDGNIYIAGSFNDTVDFDPGVDTTNLTSNGDDDVFILKLDSSGNFLWVKQIGGTLSDRPLSTRALYVDPTGDLIYLTGRFLGTVDFDPTAGTSSSTSAGDKDIFLLKLSPADTTPSTITFTSQTDKNASTTYSSNTITLAGINTGATISISGCSNASACEYSLNGAAFTSNSGTVVNGDTIILHMTSSSLSEATSTLSLTIGTVTTTYTVTNAAFASVPIFILQAQSDALRAQENNTVVFPPTNNNPINNNSIIKFQFLKNLKYKDNNTDVKELQKFLNSNGFTISTTGPGSLNNETNYFGLGTRAALIKFQLSNNIKPAVGYFGPTTRGVVNNK